MFFDFNIYSGILLPFVLHGLIFSLILLYRSWKTQNKADLLLSIIALLLTLRVSQWMLGFAGWYDSHDGHTTFMFYMHWSHWFLYGPLIWFYFLALTNKDFTWKKNYLWHLAPGLFVILKSLVIWLVDVVYNHWLRGREMPEFYGTNGDWNNYPIPVLNDFLFIGGRLSLLLYLYVTWQAYRRYKTYLLNNFSETEQIEFTWIRNFIAIFFLGMVSSYIITTLEQSGLANLDYIGQWYDYLLWGIIVYYITISGLMTHTEYQRKLAFLDTEQNQTPPVEEADGYLGTINQHMQSARPYLNPTLSLKELADQLKLSPALVSKTINDGKGENFNEYINKFRINHFKTIALRDQYEQYSLLGLAFESGFNSKATFNRVFQRLEGISPTQYLRSQKIQTGLKS